MCDDPWLEVTDKLRGMAMGYRLNRQMAYLSGSWQHALTLFSFRHWSQQRYDTWIHSGQLICSEIRPLIKDSSNLGLGRYCIQHRKELKGK